MTTEEESHINRTDRNRLGKGVAIIVIVMAIGAGLHFAFSSEWIASPPRSQLLGITQEEPSSEIILTGVIQEFQLLFVESEDLRTLAFNSTAGDQNTNPPIEVNVGDEVVIKAINSGKIPHAFGIVSDPDNPASIVFNSALKSTSDPFLRGTEGTITFTPAKEGEYYYICTIPGHAAQGMQGKFIVKNVGAEPTVSTPTEPTAISHAFDLNFVESADFMTLAFNALPGEEGTNPDFNVNVGDEITFNLVNNGKLPHAFAVVTDPEDLDSILFNSSIGSVNNPVLRDKSDNVTFMADKPGTYYYICTIPGHAAQGMQGKFIVE